MDRIIKFLSLVVLGFCLLTFGCDLDHDQTEQTNAATQHLRQSEQYQQIGQLRAAWIELQNAQREQPNSQVIAVKMAAFLNRLGQGKQAYKVLEKHLNNNNLAVDIEAATALLKQGKFHSTIEFISTTSNNRDPSIIKILADAQFALGQLAEAQKSYETLISQAQQSHKINGLIGLAKVSASQGHLSQANSKLDEVLELDKENVDALILKALIAEQQDNLDISESLLSQALQLIPDTDIISAEKRAVLNQLSKILTKQGRTTESLIYKKLLAQADPNAQGLYSKYQEALADLEDQDLENAQKKLVEIYKQTQDDKSGSLLGLISFMQNDMETADRYLSQHVDPETASFPALKAYIVSNIQLRKTEQLLKVLGPKERSRIKNPELMGLIAVALIVNGQDEEGASILNDAIKLAPKNTSLRLIQVRHQLANNHMDEAIENFKYAADLEPQNWSIKEQLLQTLLKLKRGEEALKLAMNYSSEYANDPNAHILLGNVNLALKNELNARNAFNRALTIDRSSSEATFGLAILNAQQGDLQKAKQQLINLVESSPDNPLVLRALFSVTTRIKGASLSPAEITQLSRQPSEMFNALATDYFLKLKQLNNARLFFKKLPSNSTENYIASIKQEFYLQQARQHISDKNFLEARIEILEGLGINPDNLTLLELLANLEINTGQLTEAEKLIHQIEITSNSELIVHLLRARYYNASKNVTDAASEYQKAWELHKNNQVAMELFNNLRNHSIEKAEDFVKEWKSTIPNSPEAHLNEGLLLQTQGREEQAIKAYETSLKLNPGSIVAMNNLAWLYKDREPGQALHFAKKAYDLNSQNAAIADTYGWLLVKSGKKSVGVDILKKASELAPDNKEIRQHLAEATKE